jgi:phage terminase small subunit
MTTGGKSTSQRNNLKNREKKFPAEYIKDFNGQKAAERCGYASKNARTIAWRLLNKVNIKKKIGELLEKDEINNIVHIKQIILELSKIAFADIADFEKFFETGRLEDVKGYTEVIQEITKEYTNYGPRYKLKLCSKEKALEMLGRYKAIFTDNINHSGTVAALSKEDVKAALKEAANYEKKKK